VEVQEQKLTTKRLVLVVERRNQMAGTPTEERV
jgi:hypothetical protein